MTRMKFDVISDSTPLNTNSKKNKSCDFSIYSDNKKSKTPLPAITYLIIKKNGSKNDGSGIRGNIGLKVQINEDYPHTTHY